MNPILFNNQWKLTPNFKLWVCKKGANYPAWAEAQNVNIGDEIRPSGYDFMVKITSMEEILETRPDEDLRILTMRGRQDPRWVLVSEILLGDKVLTDQGFKQVVTAHTEVPE